MNERDCIVYLRRRIQFGFVPCRSCGDRSGGHWLGTRLCWQCGRCKVQNGIRAGTVMGHSPLHLTVWFAAIKSVLLLPNITTAQLAKVVHVARAQTLRTMVQRIRAAMLEDKASELLADLDKLYLGS